MYTCGFNRNIEIFLNNSERGRPLMMIIYVIVRAHRDPAYGMCDDGVSIPGLYLLL